MTNDEIAASFAPGDVVVSIYTGGKPVFIVAMAKGKDVQPSLNWRKIGPEEYCFLGITRVDCHWMPFKNDIEDLLWENIKTINTPF